MTAAPHTHDRLGDFTTQPRTLYIAAMAALIGVAGALVAALLVYLIGAITAISYFGRLSAIGLAPGQNHLGYWAVLVPVVGGLIIGLVARFGSEKIRGHGIPEAMEAILIGRSRMSRRVAVLKPIASAIAIGTGGPFGAEGPIIMTGAALGSVFAQLLHLSDSERKTLLVAGAAAGMAAIFSAPLAAVLLAVELLLFEWRPSSFIPVAVAATIGAALRVPLLGAGPVFPTIPHDAMTMSALTAALVVGLVAGAASAVLTGLCYACEDGFAKLPIHWMWWPAIGGIVVGLGGLIAPRALGVGYDVIRDLFNGNILGAAAVALLASKAVMWAVALGSGTSGGVLAPLLMMGGAVGVLESQVIPGHDAGLWAMISMAAVMGGTMRAPLTAIVFLLELTHDVNLLPALLVACVASQVVTVLVLRRDILTEKIARRGLHVQREYSVNPLHRFRVEHVMHKVDKGASDTEPSKAVVAHPDELLDEAVRTMIIHNVKELPVVTRTDPHHVIGTIDSAAIASVWEELHDEEYVRESRRTAT